MGAQSNLVRVAHGPGECQWCGQKRSTLYGYVGHMDGGGQSRSSAVRDAGGGKGFCGLDCWGSYNDVPVRGRNKGFDYVERERRGNPAIHTGPVTRTPYGETYESMVGARVVQSGGQRRFNPGEKWGVKYRGKIRTFSTRSEAEAFARRVGVKLGDAEWVYRKNPDEETAPDSDSATAARPDEPAQTGGVRSPTSTRTEVRSPTSTRTEVRSPTSTSTSTSTKAHTSGNVTVTGGAGAGHTTVHIKGNEGNGPIEDVETSHPKADHGHPSARSNPGKPYQGHESWNAWNVALWIGNDEPLYRSALECWRRPMSSGKRPTLRIATNRFLALVGQDSKTPDGAKYSFRSVMLAMKEYEEETRPKTRPADQNWRDNPGRPTFRTDSRGVVQVLDEAAYCKRHPEADIARCGGCGRSWDDAVITGWTPAPSARCPFEDHHDHARRRSRPNPASRWR